MRDDSGFHLAAWSRGVDCIDVNSQHVPADVSSSNAVAIVRTPSIDDAIATALIAKLIKELIGGVTVDEEFSNIAVDASL